MKNLLTKLGGMISFLALAVVAMNVNSACHFWAHQPKLPKGAAKLRKF